MSALHSGTMLRLQLQAGARQGQVGRLSMTPGQGRWKGTQETMDGAMGQQAYRSGAGVSIRSRPPS